MLDIGRRKKRPDGPIRFRSNFKNTIYDVMKGRGWIELNEDDDSWDFQWAERDWVYADIDTMHFDPWQRVNHFRNGRELCRKDLLSKNIKKARRTYEKENNVEMINRYDFCPTTFVLPGDYALFAEEFKKTAHTSCPWIMKPIGKSQGQGIFLFNKLNQVSQWKADNRWKPENPTVETYVVQRYIANPYTIGGKKFDMRLYALVTSFAPLTVYIYRSGFCRFSATRYSNEKADVVNNFVHLTNVAVQKTSEAYNAETGGKWELKRLKTYLIAKHGQTVADRCFTGMQDIILLSLQAVQRTMMADRHCFEMYGYDIMFDENLKPWLLEVNASPSLTANTREDYDLKYKLLNDVLDIVDMEGKLAALIASSSSASSNTNSSSNNTAVTGGTKDTKTGNTTANSTTAITNEPEDVPRRVGGFDLVWFDGPVPVGNFSNSITNGGSIVLQPLSSSTNTTNGNTTSGTNSNGTDKGGSTGLYPESMYGTLLGADFDKRLNIFPVPVPKPVPSSSTVTTVPITIPINSTHNGPNLSLSASASGNNKDVKENLSNSKSSVSHTSNATMSTTNNSIFTNSVRTVMDNRARQGLSTRQGSRSSAGSTGATTGTGTTVSSVTARLLERERPVTSAGRLGNSSSGGSGRLRPGSGQSSNNTIPSSSNRK